MKTCILVTLSAFSFALAVNPRVLTVDFVAEINRKQSTWIAGKNFPDNTSLTYLHTIASGVIGIDSDSATDFPVIRHKLRDTLPASFDARNVWPACSSIGEVRNQGACGSCWAFGSVETMTDRLCIHSGGKIKFKFSAEDLMTCCTACGNGCHGGKVSEAFKYWINNGIVSGGDAGSNEGCQPYADAAVKNGETPACSRTCTSGYGGSYDADKRYGISTYQITSTVEQIAREIVINGPVEALYVVYEDFYNYKSGVYQHVSGNEVGWHAIKLLGWGEENGVPYWLAANSWGSSWGNLGGFFKILRGENHCKIEQFVYSGIPKLD